MAYSASTRPTAALVLILGISLLPACGQNLTDRDHIERAQEFRDQGKPSSSIIELKNALLVNPNSLQARWLLGVAYLDLKDGASAEKEFRRAETLGLQPESLQLPLARSLFMQRKWDELLNLAIPSQSSASDRAELLALRGRAHLAKGDLEPAAKEIQAALDAQASNAAARIGQALVASASGEMDTARALLLEIVEAEPTQAEAWALLGEHEMASAQFEKAEDAFNKAIANDKYQPEYRFKRLLVRVELKRLDEARSDLKTLQEMAPRHPSLDYSRGLIAFREGQYAEAQTALEQAPENNRSYPLREFYLGLAHHAQGHLEQARVYLRRFASIYPQAAEAQKALARVEIARGDDPAGIEALERVIALDPEDLTTLQLLAEATLRNGKATESVSYFRRIVAQAPGSVSANLNLGQSLMAAGENAEAMKAMEQALELDPEQSGAEYAMFKAYTQSKNFDKALQIAEQMSDKAPDDPFPWNLIGTMRLAQSDLAGAREAFEKSLALRPGYPPAAINLAKLELARGFPGKARSLYERVLESNPGHLEAHLALAALDERGGDADAAIAHVEQAIAANPQALQPRTMLARHYRRQQEPQKALEALAPVVQLYPDHPALLLELGNAQLAAGQAAEARKTLLKLTAVNPGSSIAQFLLATAAAAAKDDATAARALQAAAEGKPDFFPAKVAYSQWLIRKGELDAASEQVDQLRADHPEVAQVYALGAELAFAKRQPDEAALAYRKALDISASSEWTVGLARALWFAADYPAALQTLEEWMAVHPDDPLVQAALADAYTSAGDTSKAIGAWHRLLELQGDNRSALNNLALLLGDTDPPTALAYARQALALAPLDSAVERDITGRLLVQAGEVAKGLDLLSSAVTMDPQNAAFRYHYAQALAAAGRRDEARAAIEQALQNSKSFPEREAASAFLDELGGPGTR